MRRRQVTPWLLLRRDAAVNSRRQVFTDRSFYKRKDSQNGKDFMSTFQRASVRSERNELSTAIT